jgi:copper chaperone
VNDKSTYDKIETGEITNYINRSIWVKPLNEGKGITYMKKTILQIGGMSCQHCAKAIERALLGTPGVLAVKVDLASASAALEIDETVFDFDMAAAAVAEQGYEYLGVADMT